MQNDPAHVQLYFTCEIVLSVMETGLMRSNRILIL